MGALTEVSIYLIHSVAVFYTLLVILRFLLQWAKADFYNPVSQFIAKATTPPLTPLRRLIPGYFGLDLAAVVLAIAVQALAIVLVIFLYGVPAAPSKILTWSLLNVLGLTCKIYYFSIIVGIILSWVAPQTYHPAAQLVHQINEPVMAPIRRLLPAMGGIDFSPILAFMLLNVGDILLRHAAIASGLSGVYNIVSFGV